MSAAVSANSLLLRMEDRLILSKPARIGIVAGAEVLLKGNEADAGHLKEAFEDGKRDGAVVVVTISRISRPANTHQRPIIIRLFVQTCNGFRCGGRLQIRQMSRNGIESNLEGPRQAAKRGAQVELGQRIAGGKNLSDAWQRAHETHQRLLNRQDYAAAFLDNRLHETGEQNGVSEALLGVEQDGFIGDAGLAVPNRLYEIIGIDLELGNAQASFVIRPSALQVAHGQVNQGLIEHRLGSVGIQLAAALQE